MDIPCGVILHCYRGGASEVTARSRGNYGALKPYAAGG